MMSKPSAPPPGHCGAMTGSRKGNPPDLLVGLLLIVVAGVFGHGALGVRISAPTTMGPDFFPPLLAVLLGGIGAVLLVRSALAHRHRCWGGASLGPAFLVLLAVALFGLLLERAGLFIALFVLVSVARLADAWRGVVSIAANALVVLLVYLAVVRLLGLPVRLWPAL